jgi:peptide-methionine (S)-S-oxide reductase
MFRFSLILLCLCLGLSACAQKKSNQKVNKKKEKINMEGTQVATLAAGCFWCVEAIYQQLDGVLKVESGYAGGNVKNPSYKQVCTGETGHAEVVQLTYDTSKTSFTEILEVFFKTHDPTTLNRQGADEGTQYRSSVFYHNEEQKQIAQEIIQDLDKSGAYPSKIVTQLEPYAEYYVAENYHQNYFNQNGDSNPYCSMVIKPKIEKFQKVFKDRLKH